MFINFPGKLLKDWERLFSNSQLIAYYFDTICCTQKKNESFIQYVSYFVSQQQDLIFNITQVMFLNFAFCA